MKADHVQIILAELKIASASGKKPDLDEIDAAVLLEYIEGLKTPGASGS